MSAYKAVMSVEELTDYLEDVFPQANAYNWQLDELADGRATIRLKFSEDQLRPGGTISGPTMFALADIAAYLLILGHIGKVPLAVTTSLNINFLSRPAPGDLIADAVLLKLGKRLAVCDVVMRSDGEDQVVAQATATYSIPPRPA